MTVSAPLRTTALTNQQAVNRRRTPCNQPAAADTQRHQTPRSAARSKHRAWSRSGDACVQTAEAMVWLWSWLARLSAPLTAARGRRYADRRSTPTPPTGASHCWTRRRRYWSPPGGLQCREPASCRAARYNPAGPLARADDHGQRPWGRAWRLRGELPYGQGGHGLGQAQLPGDRLGRSPGGALGDAAGDRQGRHSGGRRHRRGYQGSAAGYLGAIGGRLHAVRSQAAAGLASSLAGPSLVRGTRRNNGQPRIITDTDRAAHGPYRPADRRAFCPTIRCRRRPAEPVGGGRPKSRLKELLQLRARRS